MSVETDPQWPEVKGMLEHVGAAPGRTGTIYSDEARLLLRAIGKPETLDRDKIGFLISDLCEQTLEYDAELGICNTGTVAFKAADQIMAWTTGGEPDNETLRSLGAFDRKCRVGKHQATNWVHLRQTIDALDAAGMSDAADTLIWVVWHEVNGTARAREYHGIETQRRADVERDYHLMCEENRRLRAGIHELIALCDQDAVDQDHNATLASWGRRSKPYAIGRGTACKGIAHRLSALLPVDTV